MNLLLPLPLLLMLLLFAPLPAAAKECKGVSFPDHVQVESTRLELNGVGVRKATILKVAVYVAALYVTKPSSDPNALLGSGGPSELILQFVRDVSADDIRKGWEEGFAKNSQAQVPALQERIAMLNGWMGDVKTGQRLIFVHKPGAGIQVEVNGVTKGTIQGEDFAKAFLSIWLGAQPPNPELKRGLLGGACE